jgi:tripartite-type tricarboxylate transporter receptor subunit TctC
MITRRETLGMGVGLAAALATGRAEAQDFPSRPINLIVMAPAGGSTDVGARVVASIAEKIAGQPMVVVNKAGAGGQVGWTELGRSKPDGYTIGFVVLPGMNTVVLDPERKATFTEETFIPIANQVLDPGVLWVRADSPYKTFQDLIDAAKKAPHTIRAATTGILSEDHLNILMTEEANPGVFFRLVHLEGNAPQLK